MDVLFCGNEVEFLKWKVSLLASLTGEFNAENENGKSLTCSSCLLIVLQSAALQKKERNQRGQDFTNRIKSLNSACLL